MKKIAILASGSGTNAERIVKYFDGKKEIEVDIILSNNSGAYVLERAKNLGVDHQVFTKEELNNPTGLTHLLKKREIDLVVLAGFLWLIPDCLIKAFSNKIINIHPALLPLYGGKKMYGMRVHQAVIDACEKESGITIHYVDEMYDHGQIVFQAKCKVDQDDSPATLAKKIHQLEYEHYPAVIEGILRH